MALIDYFFRRKEHEFGSKNAIVYSEYLGTAKTEIKIVAGELYAPYYSNKHVLKNINQRLLHH